MPAFEDAHAAQGSGQHGRPVHPLETTVVVLAAAELCGLPWAFGGVDAPAQVACLVVSLATLVVAVLPRRLRGSEGTKEDAVMVMWRRLTSFPVFWAGLALLAYVTVQAMNPSFTYRLEGTAWWLVPRDHLSGFPSGMRTPFPDMNPWRMLLIWGSVWALSCALWTGVTRRSSILAVLVALEVNGFAFAVFGILQRASGTQAIYGARPVNHPDFLAAIIYRNHAAAYFSLVASVALGLTLRAFWKSRARLDPSGPGIIHLLFCLTIVVALILSGSFAAVSLFGVLLALVLPTAAWRFSASFHGPGGDRPAFMASAALAILALGLILFVGFEGLRDRVESFTSGGGYQAARTRLLVDYRGWQMFEDRWFAGWGAGSFRYGFTKYQRREPDLLKQADLTVHWEHAHNDWLEFLIELGIFGVIPLAAIVVFWGREAARQRLWRKLAILPMLAGVVVVALHGLVDFPLQNLAIVATAGALLSLIVRWGELDAESPKTPAEGLT
jgi:O-antigen ligase